MNREKFDNYIKDYNARVDKIIDSDLKNNEIDIELKKILGDAWMTLFNYSNNSGIINVKKNIGDAYYEFLKLQQKIVNVCDQLNTINRIGNNGKYTYKITEDNMLSVTGPGLEINVNGTKQDDLKTEQEIKIDDTKTGQDISIDDLEIETVGGVDNESFLIYVYKNGCPDCEKFNNIWNTIKPKFNNMIVGKILVDKLKKINRDYIYYYVPYIIIIKDKNFKMLGFGDVITDINKIDPNKLFTRINDIIKQF